METLQNATDAAVTLSEILANAESIATQAALDATTPAALCKEHILLKETITIAEARLEVIKPLLEAARTGKETFVEGRFRNKAGRFKINHIETGQTRASLEVVKEWLAAGIISQEQYDAATKYSDSTHNRISFKAGTGK